jgi:magnesium chelatase family protein
VIDRIDLQVEVERLKKSEIFSRDPGEPSAVVRDRVIRAREVQAARLAPFGVRTNAEIPPATLEEACMLTRDAKRFIVSNVDSRGLSARGVHRVMRVGRTLADLDGSSRVDAMHVGDALNYRMFDKKR